MLRLFTWGAFVELSFSSLRVPKLLGWGTGSVTLSLLSEELLQWVCSCFLLSHLIVCHLGSINIHTMDNCNNFQPKVLNNVLLSRLWKLSCKTSQASSQEGCFLWQKEIPEYFQLAVLPHQGSSRHTKRNFPNTPKNRDQIDSQAKRRLWASRLRYNEAQIAFHVDISTGWSTVLCCSLHPRDSVNPDEDSHYCSFTHTVFTVWFWFCPMRCSMSNRNLPFAVTELQLCLDTEQSLPLARYIFPT